MGLGQVQQTGVGSSTPDQSLSTSADMFGAAQAQQSKQVGSILTEQANKMQRTEDERASMEIEQEIRDWQFEATQGDNGAFRRLGGNAIGSTKTVGEDYAKFSANLLKGKTVSPAARQKLESYIGQKGDGIRGEVNRHEMGQKSTYDNGLREARIQGAMDDAATYNNDPDKINLSLNTIISTNKRSAAENGWSKEEAEQQVQDDVSKLHMGVLERILSQKNGSQAAEYLDAYRDQIDGDDIAKAEAAVAGGVVSEKAQTVTDSIIALDVPMKEGLAKARAEYSGEERDEIVKRLKVRYGEASSEQKANEKASLEDAWAVIQSGGTPNDLSPAQLGVAGRVTESMWKMAENNAIRGEGYALTSKPGVVEEWEGMTDEELLDMNPSAFVPDTTKDDHNKLVGMVEKAEKRVKLERQNPGMSSQIKNLVKGEAGKWYSAKASETRVVQRTTLEQGLHDFVADTLDEKNRKPTDQELRDENARLMVKIIRDDGIFSSKVTTFSGAELDTPIRDISFDDGELSKSTKIPQADLDAMLAQWPKARLGEPTMSKLMNIYERGPIDAK